MPVDADPGIGVGTPIVGGAPGVVFPGTFARPLTYVTLEVYAQWLGISETAIYGIVRDGDPDFGCDDFLWNETDRFQMVKAFEQAESRLKTYLKYPLLRTYFCDEYYRYTGCEFKLRQGNVVAIGSKTEELVAQDVATGVSVLADEYSLSVAVDFTDCKELVIYYPGQTRWEIQPSKVVISGGVATISIPRARLLKGEYLIDFHNDSDRPRYETASYFLSAVDVYRRFPDAVPAVSFVWRRKSCGCRSEFACLHSPANPGQVIIQQASPLIIDSRSGNIRIEPALWNTTTGEWESRSFSECFTPDAVRVSYVAGINQDCDGNCPDERDPELARAVIALAHSNLPKGICKCAPASIYYESDSHINRPDEGPTIYSPFGMTAGQNLAWQIVKGKALGWGGLFG